MTREEEVERTIKLVPLMKVTFSGQQSFEYQRINTKALNNLFDAICYLRDERKAAKLTFYQKLLNKLSAICGNDDSIPEYVVSRLDDYIQEVKDKVADLHRADPNTKVAVIGAGSIGRTVEQIVREHNLGITVIDNNPPPIPYKSYGRNEIPLEPVVIDGIAPKKERKRSNYTPKKKKRK